MSRLLGEFFSTYSNLISLCVLNSFVAYGVSLALSANLFSLATGGFMAIGAYLSVYLTMQAGLPFAVAVLFASVAASLAALAIGAPVLRLRGDYFLLATFAFTEVVRVIAINWESVTGGAIGIMSIPRYTDTTQMTLLVVVLIYVSSIVKNSYFGRALSAIRQDEILALTMGVNAFRYRLTLFVASGAISGAAGALAAHLNFFIGPSDFGLSRSLDALTAPILGGMNTVFGPLIGAIIVTVLPEALRFSSQWREICMGGLVLAIVMFMPTGVISLGAILKTNFRTRYLTRRSGLMGEGRP